MPGQVELECVSCESEFEPAPNGGFCPDCDTPHPDYDLQDDADDESADDEETESADEESAEEESAELEYEEDESADADDADDDADDAGAAETEDEDADADEIECGSCGSAVDASMSFCPDCGSELGADDDGDETEEREIAACPDCGTSIDGESYCPDCGTHLDPIRESAGSDDGDADDADEVTLVVAGESYTFGDGDTFGRQDADWLDDLVAACGGREAATYVSGEHLEFAVEDDGVYVTDISTNGTAHNGTDLDGDTAKLEDGDTLELADRADIDVEL